jgi:predicted transcriptional regulator
LGNRRVVAVGGEGCVLRRRLGLRAGARFNTTGAEEQAYTAGASVVVRSGMFIDAHVVYGGADDESGWGITGRASF